MTRNTILPAILWFRRPGLYGGGYIYGYKFARDPGMRDLRTAAPAMRHACGATKRANLVLGVGENLASELRPHMRAKPDSGSTCF